MKTLFFIFSCVLLAVSGSWAQTDSNRITFPNHNEEDPWLMRAQDGRYYMSFFSDSQGTADIWITRSADGANWETPWVAIQGPDNDWLPSIVQAPDNAFHLVWFRSEATPPNEMNIWHSRSADAVNWSTPTKITDTAGVDWVPGFLIDSTGVFWVAWASTRTGNMDIFITRSADQGVSWSAPARITTDSSHDITPFLFQKSDGSYLLAWHRYSGPIDQYLNSSCEVFYSASADGLNWGAAIRVTRDTAGPAYVDALPILYENPATGEINLAWTSNRFNPFGSTVQLSLSAIQSGATGADALPLPGTGYGARIIPAGAAGQFLMVWVADPDGDFNRDIYHQFIYPSTPIRSMKLGPRHAGKAELRPFDVAGRKMRANRSVFRARGL